MIESDSQSNINSNDHEDIEVANHKLVKKLSNSKKMNKASNNTEIIDLKVTGETKNDQNWKKTKELVKKKCCVEKLTIKIN
jgi:hypothetical protein